MEGINFMIDEKVAVIIDLKRYGELWKDFYDRLIAYERRNEPRESLESVRKKLVQKGNLSIVPVLRGVFCTVFSDIHVSEQDMPGIIRLL